VTLDQVALEVQVKIVGFAPIGDGERARLSGLGVRLGVLVTKLIPTPLQDPIECLVGTQLLAMERRLLRLIRVEAC